jgi:hypothetical protein
MAEKARKVEIYRHGSKPFYNIFVGCERIAEYISHQWATAIVNAYNKPVSNKAMKDQLQTLAKRECDNCQERDCADCWAIDYFKGD